MPNPNIGKILCPSCDNLADVREDKKQNAYIVCGCGYQAFTRDKKSNENIRRKMTPETAPPAVTPPETAPPAVTPPVTAPPAVTPPAGNPSPAKKNHGTLLG